MSDGLLTLPEDTAVAALRRELQRLDEWGAMEAGDIKDAEQALKDAVWRDGDRKLRRAALLTAIEKLTN